MVIMVVDRKREHPHAPRKAITIVQLLVKSFAFYVPEPQVTSTAVPPSLLL